MAKVGIYARESSDDLSKAPPIEAQVERGRAWAAEQGHEVVRVYADNGCSGGDWKRPEWNQAVSDARRHLYQLLWTWNQDRLARDTEQFLWFYRNLNEARVRIWEDTSNDFIDLSTLGNRVKYQSLAQAAEIFRLVTGEKVKQAYQRNLKAGRPWGRPKMHTDTQKALELRLRGWSWRKIGAELGCSHTTIKRLLQNSPIVLRSKD